MNWRTAVILSQGTQPEKQILTASSVWAFPNKSSLRQNQTDELKSEFYTEELGKSVQRQQT